jgi:hypothetical protein
MSNLNVKKQLENISVNLAAVLKQVVQHSGVSEENALFVDSRCSEIAEMAARIGTVAREAQGNRSSKTLVTKVRKALGYSYPKR